MEKEASEWQTYRTRFLVRARRLNGPMSFVDPIGREQRGNVGDYLVESAIGVRRIMPRKFFEDVYVAIEPENPARESLPVAAGNAAPSPPPVGEIRVSAVEKIHPAMHPSH